MSISQIESKPFSDLLSNIVDNRGKTCPISESGIALIATNCIKNDNLYPVYENVRHVSAETYKNWFRGHPEPGDFIFVTKGTPGRVCLVPKKVDFCIAQDMVAIRADSKKIDPKYLFAALRSTDIQGEIENLHVGSLIPHFKKGDFDKLIIPLPERELQEYIGEQYLLFSIKIDLLNRQNKTLEGMAEALWRKAFVEEADPEWKVGKIGDFVKTTSGGTPSRNRPDYYDNGNYKWVKSKELQCTFIIDTEEKINEEGLKYSSAKLLPKNTLLLAMYGATVGEYGILAEQATCNQAVCAFLPNEHYPYTFIYMFLKMNKEEIINNAVGSAQQNISQIVIQNLEVFQPNHAIIQFHKTVEGGFEKIKSNIFQIRTLSRLRDTLLPKLMSGEMRVSL